jgi:hypothetical protein
LLEPRATQASPLQIPTLAAPLRQPMATHLARDRTERCLPCARTAKGRIELDAEGAFPDEIDTLLVTRASTFDIGRPPTAGWTPTERLETLPATAAFRNLIPAEVLGGANFTRPTPRHAGQPEDEARTHEIGIALAATVDDLGRGRLAIGKATAGGGVAYALAVQVRATLVIFRADPAGPGVAAAHSAGAIGPPEATPASGAGAASRSPTIDIRLRVVLDAVPAAGSIHGRGWWTGRRRCRGWRRCWWRRGWG